MSKKKVLEFFLKSGKIIQLEDLDPLNIVAYTAEISKIFDINNIFILTTTSGHLICRPSELSGILVQERSDNLEQIKNKTQIENVEEEPQGDFITDGEDE